MKKKISVILALILALSVFACVAVGCGEDNGDVTVKISKAELTVEVGKSSTLSATASNGAEIVWSTSNDSVATVNDKGKVTGVKAGTATVTAKLKNGKASASCEVTVKNPVVFTFKDGEGNTVTSVNLDRDETIQLTAIADDGSAITGWTSDDEKVATVSGTGLVTGVDDGEATITVKTSTGTGTIKVTVTDSFQGDKYKITTTEETDKWYYYAREDGGREWTFNTAEFRGDVVTFDYDGTDGNWNSDDLFLAIKKSDVEDGGVWHELTMKINSSVAATVTINGTRVDLVVGDNDVAVAYEQWEFASAIIVFGNGEAGSVVPKMHMVITDVAWSDFTPVDLQTPTFTLVGDKITITENAANPQKGVHSYQIGLFEDGNEEPVFIQPIRGTSGTLDTSSAKKNGTFTVKIRVHGNLGYNDSAWSDTTVTYEVTNADLPYNLSNPDGKHGGGASAALKSGKWEFFTITEEGASCNSARYEDGTLTFDGTNGWSADCVQLLRNYAEYAAGTELTITMTLKSSVAGDIMVCGEKVTLAANEEKTVTVTVTQGGTPTITIILDTLAPNHAEDWPNKTKDPNSLPTGAVVFTVSDVTVAVKA